MNQIYEITLMNLRNLRSRLGSSSVIVVGIAGVVAVLVGLLSMATGFRAALENTGRADRAIIMREGTTSEMNGAMTAEDRAAILVMEGVAMGSGEVYVVAAINKKASDTPANVVVRGVEPTSFDIRPELTITSGRRFEAGRAEIVVGIKAASEFAGLNLGNELLVRDQAWQVVGAFCSRRFCHRIRNMGGPCERTICLSSRRYQQYHASQTR